MDSLTHTLTGGVIAKAIDDEKLGNWGTVAGLAAGFFPDTDFVLGLFDRQFYIQYHRDFTHSLFLIPVYAFVLSWLFTKLSRRPYLWRFYKICLPVLVSHVLLDLFTSYGTMIFSPLFETRVSWDLVFIIDLVFSGIIALPFLINLFWKKNVRWLYRGSLIGLAVYVLFCWSQHHRAIQVAEIFSQDLKEKVIQVAALPQPLSPFRWANYVETRTTVYQGFVDFLRKKNSPDKESLEPLSDSSTLGERMRALSALYEPPKQVVYRTYSKFDSSPWVEKALATEGTRFYYWFARFPVVKSVNSRDGVHRVEFVDVRFLLPGIRTPFIYYVEFDDSGNVRSQGFEREREKPSRREPAATPNSR
jgi:inner membrane protein